MIPSGIPPATLARSPRWAHQHGSELLLAVTDASVGALLQQPDIVPPRAVLPFPSHERYRLASDKVGMLDYAVQAGLAVPESRLIESRGADVDIPGEWMPAVLKPHRSVVGSAARAEKLVVSLAEDRPSLQRALSAFPPEAFPVLLQRRVSGPGVGLFLLRWNGRVVAAFAHRRLREKPPAGGVSTYRESVVLDPGLFRAGARLLELLDWQGVAMIECKREEHSGRYVFMEMNGRLWGSLQLAIDAGIDFPALLADCVLGTPRSESS
ncbi:MAG: ATP-grasp domain-containing protein [Gemmatimonadetes bacterium]|nr:ATP-grasp domain-containing protein [Gemmatimonadota bacterium]